ncbi:hypothetical protein LTR56_010044 [Elasticomyces elasticus]|nr:hypothetical protein LTR56_010044 [Elasticomyces elasticus]KAK3665011.1 hypothetical protein LTR22_004064 [Elasticomyces elasticus]KAK4931613.1 hypothetical protein LTR49_002004 [Elasticomyces elasticus]KAK5766772.1 hypothetical protein LTS12_003124 [Elasticomyces elasticus]
MEDPDHGKLLINYRTDAKKLKLSVVRHIERLINKVKADDAATNRKRKAPADIKRAKKGRKSAHFPTPDASMNTLPEIGGRGKARSTPNDITGSSDEVNTTTSKLRMVHWIDCVFEETSVRCGIERYVKTDSKLYALGGPVFRVLINGTLQDVMVCIKGVCNNCRIVEDPDDTIAPTILAAAENLLQGRPFVHTNDIDLKGLRQGGNCSYKGTSGPWSPTFPATWTAGDVEFTFDQHQMEVPVVACVVGKCEQCHAQTAEEETVEGTKKGKAAVGKDGKEGRLAKKFGSGGMMRKS